MSNVKSHSLSHTRVLIPPWLTDRWGMVGIGLSLYLLVFLAWTYLHWGGAEHISLIGNLAILPPMLLATFMTWRVAVQKHLSPRVRRAWFLLGIGCLMNFIGSVTWTYLENVLNVEPFPSMADVFYLAFYPLVLWGLLTLPSVPQNKRERLIFWLDLLSVLTIAAMFVAYFIIVPMAAAYSSDTVTEVIAIAYPIGSLLLIGGMVAILFQRPPSDTQAALHFLLVGMTFYIGSDLAFGYTSLAGTYTVGGWIDAGWNVAQIFFVLAALRQMYSTLTPSSKTRPLAPATMTILRKAFLIISVSLALLTLVLFLLISFIQSENLASRNQADARENASRSLASISYELETLDLITKDYATWDDTYAFALTGFPQSDYVIQNLQGDTFENLGINLFMVIRADGRVLYANSYDHLNSTHLPTPKDLLAYFASGSAPLKQLDQNGQLSGFVLFPHGPMLVAARPILTSQGDGPSRGYLIMGRFLDQARLDVIGQLIGLDLSVYRLDGQVLPPHVQSAMETLTVSNLDVLGTADANAITSYALLEDPQGTPTLVLSVIEPSSLSAAAQSDLRIGLLGLLAINAAFGVLIVILLNRLVLSRLTQLSVGVQQVELSGDLSTRVEVTGGDEMADLAAVINRMLASLEQARNEREKAEVEIRWLARFPEESPAPILRLSAQGEVLYGNLPGLELLRDLTGDLESVRFVAENWKAVIARVLASGRRAEQECQVNGRVYVCSFVPVPAAGYVNLYGVDVTDQRRAVLALRESEQRFRLLFDASPDAIFLIDPHDSETIWSIVDCNEAACIMNGYRREDLIGKSLDLLNVKKGSREDFAAVLEKLRREGVVRGLEATHRHKDGHVFPIEYSTSLITIGDRELVLGIDRDITKRKQVEQALNQTKEMAEAASRAKSEFLSRMSHELRTPMNAILGFAQLLNMSRKEPLTPIQKERVKQISKGGQHLLDLINEILDISRIEAGRLQISPEPVPIRESIQEVLDLTAPLAADRHIQIQTSLEIDANPFVMADGQRLKQVLLNLLSNAVKYNYDGGYVMVSCEQTPADGWRISVTDTGSGIPPENLGRLFVPFERLSADQSNIEGTGLGLALAKRLVELMEGQIGVESIVGRGSTFWIELPSAESQLERLQRTGGTGQLPVMSATARAILYIEDNIANFELIQQVLADYSQIELFWAADPQTGVELARLHHPNLILLDLHLGSRDGAEVLKQLKQDIETAMIPVVMVSADATSGQIERLISLGAHSYLTKPLDIKRFIQLIEELLTEKAH